MSADPQAAYAWIIRGLGGVINMINREAVEGTPITPYWLAHAEAECARLSAVLAVLRGANDGGEKAPE